MMKGKEILVTRMYAGKYQESNNNLAHEFINLFKADNGKNYIYVTSDGTLGQAHNMYDIESILLVQLIDKNHMDIIAKAENLEPFSIWDKKKSNEINQKFQKEFILREQIGYGGKNLLALLKGNSWNIGANPSKAYITYKAGKVSFASKGLILDSTILNKNFPSTSLKWYYSLSNSREYKDYTKVKMLIDNKSNWIEDKETEITDFASSYMRFLKARIRNKNFEQMLHILNQRIKENG